MPILTIEAIRENPWNVMTRELPEHPSRLLLILAALAATLCRQMQDEILGDLDRLYGNLDATFPPEYRAAIDNWFSAYRKQGEVGFLLEDRLGVPMLKFSLTRIAKEEMTMFEKCKSLLWR